MDWWNMHFNDITYMNGCVSHQTEELDTCRYYYHWQPSSSGPGDRQHDNMSMMLKAKWSLCQISIFMKLKMMYLFRNPQHQIQKDHNIGKNDQFSSTC